MVGGKKYLPASSVGGARRVQRRSNAKAGPSRAKTPPNATESESQATSQASEAALVTPSSKSTSGLVGPRELNSILRGPWNGTGRLDLDPNRNNSPRALGNAQDSDDDPNTVPTTPTPLDKREARIQRREENKVLGAKGFRKGKDKMAGVQSKWKEEQVLIICPGSQTTLAQLGCHELTPPTHRIPTRMFRDEETGDYRPYFTYKRKKSTAAANGDADGEADVTKTSEDDYEWVEDRDSVEGAIYPIVAGRIVNMDAFLAFIEYVHGQLTTTYHNTPIVLMASAQWTRGDCQKIARYVFEKTKTPSLCLANSAVVAQYGLKWPNMTVIDIGYEKVDVTCFHDSNIVSHNSLGSAVRSGVISGGEVFTRELQLLLKDKNFTHDMAEQLKKSPICEVLPYAPELPDAMDLPAGGAPVTAPTTLEPPKINEPPRSVPPHHENGNAEDKETEDGVLDIANIVTGGNAREFLAKREKEKAEKAKSKKGKGQEAEPAPAKPVRLPNSKKLTNIFHYEELVHEDIQVPAANGVPVPEGQTATNGDAAPGEAKQAEGESATPANGEPIADALPLAAESANESVTERRTKRIRRDIEVGLERFTFANRFEIDKIVDTIYQTIQSIGDLYQRGPCWENIVFVGNGSRLKGLKENIMQTLTARYLISPSSATIFTSELPSNMATPTGTGSQTPTGSFTGQIPLPTAGGVNPLLQAATTASLGVPGLAQGGREGSMAAEGAHHSHQSHGQTPTSIKLATLPTYLAEWQKNGFEEAMFLGSLIMGRMAFCTTFSDQSIAEVQYMMSMNRVDYNKLGPSKIREYSMLGM